MDFPNELKYTAGHEWVRINDNEAIIGITSFAQSELGGIVYVDIDTRGEKIERNEVFGSIEAVKTASDLMMPMTGGVLKVNEELEDAPELVNKDPYDEGRIVKVAIANPAEVDELLDAASCQEEIGKQELERMQPLASVIMDSTSDLPIMQRTAKQLEALEIPLELLALSAHRIPDEVTQFARSAEERGMRVIIAAAGVAVRLCNATASMTTLPVVGVPIDASLEGLDALLAIVWMPLGIPVATVGVSAAQNMALLAAQILALGDPEIAQRVRAQEASLKEKIVKASKELAQISNYKYKTN